MRVLAIDYGDARTGIAISDASGSIVGRTTVIHSRRPQQTAEAIAALVRESGAERLARKAYQLVYDLNHGMPARSGS